MVNAKIREFENDIINYINASSDVPIEVKHLVLKDILHQVETEANRNIIAEQEKAKEKNEKESADHE
jgi:hypothetical protein